VRILPRPSSWTSPFEATTRFAVQSEIFFLSSSIQFFSRGSLAELVGFSGQIRLRADAVTLHDVLDIFDLARERSSYKMFAEQDLMAQLAKALLHPADRASVCRKICPQAPVEQSPDPPLIQRPPVSRFAEDAGIDGKCATKSDARVRKRKLL
jgi:hypothetical protein